MMTNRFLRQSALTIIGAEILFWFYTFYYIGAHANPRGDGMEWLGEMPLTGIVILLVAPAFAFSLVGRRVPWASIVALILAILAAVADIALWTELLSEFHH